MLALAGGASAKVRPDIPAGSPLGAGTPIVVPDQIQPDRQRLQLQAAARARANARAMADAFEPATPTAPVASLDQDPGRARAPAFGQSVAADEGDARRAPSPYGGYYQIRTPWDRR